MEKKSILTKEVFTECEIAAPVTKVFAVLSDFANYKNWTDSLLISGEAKPDGKICLEVKVPNFKWQKFSSKLDRMDENIISFHYFTLAPFAFNGKQRFEMIPISENKTRFINSEVFKGLALPVLQLKNFIDNVRKFKEDTNLALKRAAESLPNP